MADLTEGFQSFDFDAGFDEPAAQSAGAPAAINPNVSVVVVESDPTRANELLSLCPEARAHVPDCESLVDALTGDATVAVLGPSCTEPRHLAIAERLVAGHPEVRTLLVADELSTALLRQALRAGVRDVLALPLEPGQLTEAVSQVSASMDGAVVAAASSTDTGGPRGRVITVFSTKGGAGKSVVASNLAVALANRSGGSVTVVDADLQFGDIAVMLKLSPKHTVVDAVANIDRLDRPMFESLLIEHERSGVRVLPAPLEPAFADQISGQEVVKLVETARQMSDYVVVDTPAYFNDVVLGVIEISDDVLLVTGMDIPNIKNVKIGLQTLRLLNTPLEKVRLVLNRSDSKVKLDIGEVERTLKLRAECLIPSDIVVPVAVNRGTPVIESAPKSGVTRALIGLADQIIAEQAEALTA
jgi:pilus assembly protein CpaE